MRLKIKAAIIVMLCVMMTGCGNKTEEKEVITISTGTVTAINNTDNTEGGETLGTTTAGTTTSGTTSSEITPSPRDEYGKYDGTGYCEFRNISLSEITDFTSKAVIYYQPNPEEYNMPVDANIHFGDIKTTVNGDTKEYTIPVAITVCELYSSDNVKYSGCITPSIEFADNLTGGIIPVRDTKGNDKYNYEITFATNDKEYKIAYGLDVTIKTGDYRPEDNGNYVRDVTFNAVYTVKAPGDYDGLIMKITPCTSFRGANVDNIDSDNRLLDEENEEGTIYVKL